MRMIVQIENQTIEANLAALMEQIEKCLLAQKRFATDPIEIICDDYKSLFKKKVAYFAEGFHNFAQRRSGNG